MRAKRKTETPLETLTALLPKMGANELIEAATLVFEEGAERADTYEDLLTDSEPPTDAVNGGLVFVLRFGDVYDRFFYKDRHGRIAKAHRKLREAEKDLQLGEPLSVN